MLATKVDMSRFVLNGIIDYGQFVRYWRKEVMAWHNTKELVALYNEMLLEVGERPVSKRWWERLEANNRVPVDEKRRRIIQMLLHIPPTLIGLGATSLFSHMDDIIHPEIAQSSYTTSIDVASYQSRLIKIWSSPYNKLEEVLQRIYSLQEAYIYGKSSQKENITHLLCQYLVLAGNIQRAQGNLTSAIFYLDKAAIIAKDKYYHELHAEALYLRGYSYFERWTLHQRTNHNDFVCTFRDFNMAQRVIEANAKHVEFSDPLKAAVLCELGNATANQAEKDQRASLSKVDAAGHIVSASSFRYDPLFLKVDEEWYHIDRAESLLALNMPNATISELSLVYKGNSRIMRRYLTAGITEAEAYVAKGQIEIGVLYAEEALHEAKGLESPLHFARLVNLYEELRKHNKFRNQSDVIRFGFKLAKVQHPDLFVK